jgi:DNA-binding NarL/FixJ family response regulator
MTNLLANSVPMIRTILFEDNQKFRNSLGKYLASSGNVFLSAAFPNAENALKHYREIKPDVVLMDINLPGKSGIEAMTEIKTAHPEAKVLMLTIFNDEDKIFQSLCNGANGYALKETEDDAEDADILTAITNVAKDGGGYISPAIAAKTIKFFQHPEVQKHPDFEGLTPRQLEVLDLLSQGKSRKMIASRLEIAQETVNDHIKDIYRRLEVNSAIEAVRKAVGMGLIRF